MLAIALSFINTDLATTSLDSEDWQQVVTLGEWQRNRAAQKQQHQLKPSQHCQLRISPLTAQTTPLTLRRPTDMRRHHVPTYSLSVCVCGHAQTVHTRDSNIIKNLWQKDFYSFMLFVCFLFQYINLNPFPPSEIMNKLKFVAHVCCWYWYFVVVQSGTYQSDLSTWLGSLNGHRRLEQLLNRGSVGDQHVIKKSDLWPFV